MRRGNAAINRLELGLTPQCGSSPRLCLVPISPWRVLSGRAISRAQLSLPTLGWAQVGLAEELGP